MATGLERLWIDLFPEYQKTEEDMTKRWVDNRLTVACKHGFTLLYDEFTRSAPEANNVLLSILSEKCWTLGGKRRRTIISHGSTLILQPIFTSNPEEYAGIVHREPGCTS